MGCGAKWTAGLATFGLVVSIIGVTGHGRAVAQDGPPPPPQQADEPTPAPTTRPLPPLAPGERRLAVTFAGGHDTDPRDRGRPVILVAAGLGVPADVFRQVFSHVHPAGPGSGGPTDAEARQNKRVLMHGLSKYGVTDARINTVSNRYRYMRSRGQLWRHRDAVAFAVERDDGRVVRFDIADPGMGYSTPPTVTVDGHPELAVTVTLAFGTDLDTNGSVKTIAVQSGPATRP